MNLPFNPEDETIEFVDELQQFALEHIYAPAIQDLLHLQVLVNSNNNQVLEAMF